MKELEIFREIAADPHGYARNWKSKKKGQVIGYFCSYTPEELIHAAGALPFRIFGTREHISHADRHLQAYCCSLVRGGLEEALDGKLKFLDGTVFPHTCDSIQRLSDIWRLNAGYPIHIDVVLPVKLNSDSALQYMIDLFHRFKADLEKSLGTNITDDALKESIQLYNRLRRAMREIYRARSEDPALISGSDVYAIIKSSLAMERTELLATLEQTVEALKKQKAGDTDDRKRIILAGGVCNHPDIYGLLEDSGGVVVWDDLCTGSRLFGGDIADGGDLLNSLSIRYYERVVCPAKHKGETSRGDNLLELVKKYNAHGVIFLILKFCDPHSFDYPYMKEILDSAEIPSLLLELEEQLPPAGQLKTRFETFIEML
jgi:bzd-type benzoyl-CoA reductase N subunit